MTLRHWNLIINSHNHILLHETNFGCPNSDRSYAVRFGIFAFRMACKFGWLKKDWMRKEQASILFPLHLIS
jgi:hypothetical protein